MRSSTALTLLCFALGAVPAHAQGILPVPLAVEVRIDGGVPTGDFANRSPGIEAEPGPGAAVAVAVGLARRISLRAGYSRTSFGCPRCGSAGLDDELLDHGADLSLRADLATPLSRIELFARAGGVYHQLRFSGSDGELVSDDAPGLDLAVGLGIALPGGFRLEPGLAYRAYSADLDLGGLPGQTVDVSYLVLGAGLSYLF